MANERHDEEPKVYQNLGDAILNNGTWGPFDVTFPFCLVARDTLKINGDKVYVTSRAITLSTENDVAEAIENGTLLAFEAVAPNAEERET